MKGVIYKGDFWPLYGGGILFNSINFSNSIMADMSPTLRAEKNDAGVCVETFNNNDMAKIYRIRKLTPTECMRLMGVKDEDTKKMKDAGISDSQLYKMAGNSIVVNVLEGIFTQMFRKDTNCLF